MVGRPRLESRSQSTGEGVVTVVTTVTPTDPTIDDIPGSVGWFDEGSERADAAILQLRHATRKDMDLYFEGLVRPARDESYMWRRNHAAAILTHAFESESNSGWTERVDSFLVV